MIGAPARRALEREKITTLERLSTYSEKELLKLHGVFKGHVKLNFFKGASLNDPQGLFNAGLEAKTSRAIDFYQDDAIDASALQDLIRAAVAQNSK